MSRTPDPAGLWDRFAGCRYDAASPEGHYESYFLRANHPSASSAFWIRYTLFSPKGRPEAALGELWAIAWDAETGRTTAVKTERPLSECAFGKRLLSVLVGAARLDEREASGEASSRGHRIGWELSFPGGEPPLLLIPSRMYDGGFPKAKMMVLAPNARFTGAITVDGVRMPVDDWVGSVNHNWGRAHTDEYAWGQVAGFDGAPGTFLEVGTGRIRLGGRLYTPRSTPLVLRMDDGETIAVNTLFQSVRTRANYTFFDWSFDARARGVSVRGRVSAPRAAFVGLTYPNPPGGAKTCLNSKIARCELTVERVGRPSRTLISERRAAFEILTDRADHGVELSV